MPPSEFDVQSTSSPDRSLSNLLRRSTSKKQKHTSAVSIASEDGKTREEQSKLKMSLDKIRVKTRASHDVERSSSQDSGRLAKLIRSGSRRKNSHTGDEQSPDTSRVRIRRRGRKKNAGQLGVHEHDSRLHVSASAESLGLSPSGGSSLLTEGSDPDLPAEQSSLTPNDSHEEYLTFTSPLIETETLPSPRRPIVSATDNQYPNTRSHPESAIPANPSLSGADAGILPRHRKHTSSTGNVLSDRSKHPTLSLNDGSEEFVDDSNKSVTAAGSPASFTSFFGNLRKSGGLKKDRTGSDTSSIRPASAGLSLKPAPTTPSTFVTPPTPTFPQSRSPSPTKSKTSLTLGALPKPPRIAATPSEKGIVHRRARSATAASTASGAGGPVTPIIEESSTPGGTVITPSGSSGFFSSFWTSTQNAVNSISTTLNQSSTSSLRKRSDTVASDPKDSVSDSGVEEVVLSNPRAHPNIIDLDGQSREPAVKTLGSGNLSLSQLGIEEESMTSKTDLSDGLMSSPASFPAIENEEVAAAHDALTGNHPKPSTPVVNDTASTSRPRSLNSNLNSVPGDGSPPRAGTLYEPDRGLGRTGSTRSRLSGKRRAKRSRNSSTATGSAIAAALASSHSALAHPGASGSTSQIQGFAVASSKRNKDFHALFKSVPEDDYLIEDYSAALQRDILLHGRLYVSEKHVCFSSNILGWVTNLVISFDEIVSVEKKSTALIFPNAITIQTLHARNVFASFLNRDQTYDLLIGIWKIGHPNLKSSENGHVLDEDGGDKAEGDSIGDEEDSDDESDYSGDDASSIRGSMLDVISSVPASEAGDFNPRAAGHKPSGSGPAALSDPTSKTREAGEGGAGAALGDFPGPKEHPATDATDVLQHYEKSVPEELIPAPLGKVYTMLFGPDSGVVMRKFLLEDQKVRELQLEDDKKGMGDEVKQFSYTYIRPLPGGIGPKQTKCIVNQTLDFFDLNKAVVVTCSTQTPDVPSGNSFVVKTKYSLVWGPNNSTKFQMSWTVEWSAKSWLKGPIESGSNAGQAQYGSEIAAFAKNFVTARGGAKAPRGGKVKSKKKRSATAPTSEPKGSSEGQSQKGGFLAPVIGMLGPVGDLLEPLVSTTTALAVLLVIVSALWLRSSYGNSTRQAGGLRDPLVEHASRMAAYDELWRREELQLWDWLEDRIQLNDIALGERAGAKKADETLAARDVPVKMAEEKLGDQQVEEAIRVTEERLASLKAAHERRKH